MSAAGPASRQGLTGLAGWVVDVVEALGMLGIGLLVAAENVVPPIPSEIILPWAASWPDRAGCRSGRR